MTRVRSVLDNQGGVSLIELLITLLILSIAFLVILGGMTGAIVLSDLHRRQARAETILRQFAETIKAVNYEPCAADGTYDGKYTVPDPEDSDDFFPDVLQVRHWSSAGFVPASVIPECSGGPPTDNGIQLVKLEVKLSDNKGVEQVEVVKRDLR